MSQVGTSPSETLSFSRHVSSTDAPFCRFYTPAATSRHQSCRKSIVGSIPAVSALFSKTGYSSPMYVPPSLPHFDPCPATSRFVSHLNWPCLFPAAARFDTALEWELGGGALLHCCVVALLRCCSSSGWCGWPPKLVCPGAATGARPAVFGPGAACDGVHRGDIFAVLQIYAIEVPSGFP